MSATSRDLASVELWQQSLERSHRLRALAPVIRKRESRKKRASLVVSAAVAAAPFLPNLASAVASGPKSKTDTHKPLDQRRGDDVLLVYGVTDPSVAQIQRALHITVDGIFGPQTEAAVAAFQKRSGLPATGVVDVRTWLTLFPHDTIIYAPGGKVPTGPGGDATAAGTNGATTAAVDTSATPGAVERAVAAVLGGHGGSANGGVAAPGDGGWAAPTHHSSKQSGHIEAAAPEAPSGPAEPGVRVHGHPATGGATPHAPAVPHTAPAPHSAPAPQSSPAPPPVRTPGVGGSVADLINAMIREANRITSHHYAYRWGGGHNPSFSGPYDCSGAVSAVLHAAGLISRPMVSGDFTHWGAPGRGAVTLYANAGHVYMSILGRYFGTSFSNPGGGAGWFRGGPRPGFVVVHVPFERMHLRAARAVVERIAAHRPPKHRRHTTTRRSRSAPTQQSYGGSTTTQQSQTTTSGGSTSTSGTTQAQTASAPQSSGTDTSSGTTTTTTSTGTTSTGTAAPAPAPATSPAPTTQPAPTAPAPTTQSAPAPAPSDPAPSDPAPSDPAPAAPAPGASAPAPTTQSAPAPAPTAPAPTTQAAPAPAPSAPAPASDPAPTPVQGGDQGGGAGDSSAPAPTGDAGAQTPSGDAGTAAPAGHETAATSPATPSAPQGGGQDGAAG